MSKQYITFRESNQWEGESWNFYIPVEGNKEAIEELQKISNGKVDAPTAYVVKELLLTENDVNGKVKDCDSGYLNYHNKLEGRLDLKRLKNYKKEAKKIGQCPLYKGGIESYVVKDN